MDFRKDGRLLARVTIGTANGVAYARWIRDRAQRREFLALLGGARKAPGAAPRWWKL